MTISDAISEAKKLTGAVVDDETYLRWLSELDGQIAVMFFQADGWLPYTDVNTELLIPFPWDGSTYVHYLEAQTYYTNGEYDRYENARIMSEQAQSDFRKYMQRTHQPAITTIGGHYEHSPI
jgi:hypothetical protein